MAYDINKIRKNIQDATSKKKDPDEFRPATATDKPIKYRFFVLPPLQEGDVIKTGTVSSSMENFFMRFGQHWVNDKPHSCPRVWDGSDCDICSVGFKLLKECKAKNLGDAHRQAISKQWMPSQYYVVNIYFTNSKTNPEELRGQTKFYRAPKTVYEKWEETVLKDDSGDEENPEAFGIFFDENAGFVFELTCTNGGKYNDYKQSKFISNNGIPQAMVTVDGQPDKAGIKALLKSRINLFEKLESPDAEKIKRLASSMIDGDDEDDNGGFDADENETAIKSKQVSKVVEEDDDEPVTESKRKVADVEEDEEQPKQHKKQKPEPKPEPKPKKEVTDDDDDIENLLGQLDD